MSSTAVPVRAKDVQTERGERGQRRAHCYRPDCTVGPDGAPWVGEWRPDYQAANTDRQAHLDEHRAHLETSHG